MELEYIRQLLKIFDESSAAELSIESDGNHIHISRYRNDPIQQTPTAPMIYPASLPHVATASALIPSVSESAEQSKQAAQSAISEHTVISPIVGTFYRAANPGADPFIQIGSQVSVGDTLCIVEAMKLMNNIESDCAGTVLKILVENGQPVEYNQPLFIIQPS